MKYIAALFFICLFGWSGSAQAGELFTGTLEINGDQPYLVRCDLVKNTYRVVDRNGDSTVWLAELKRLGVGRVEAMMTGAIGEAEMRGEEVILKVEDLGEVKPGSCHLDSMF